MSKKFLPLAAAALFLCSLSAQAQGLYLGVSVGNSNFQQPGNTFHGLSLTGHLGYRIASFLDIEARVATSTNDSINGNDFQLRYMGSAFAKLNWQPMASKHFELYGMIGGSYMQLRNGPTGATTEDGDISMSYGFGIALFGTETDSLNLEWVRYGDSTLNDVVYTLDNLSIGYVHHF